MSQMTQLLKDSFEVQQVIEGGGAGEGGLVSVYASLSPVVLLWLLWVFLTLCSKTII